MQPITILVALLLLFAGPASAGLFDDPKNLKVLPDDISSKELGATMRGFSIGTGLRCSGCHVGEENQQLTEYDFESDEKELKKTARMMLEMLNDINGNYLQKWDKEHLQVECVTCHRGVKSPKLLGQVLSDAGAENGAEGVTETYANLKSKYYGTHSYDFSELTLSEFARSQGLAGNMPEAIAMLDIMLGEDPESFQAHFLYGELKFLDGDMVKAKQHLQEALKINPKAGFISRRLAEIEDKQI